MDPTFFGHKLIFTNLFVFLSLCIYVSVFLCLFATISVTLRICICICMSMCHVRIHVSLSASLYLYLKGVKKKRQLFIVWSFCVLYEYFCDCFAIHCLNKCPLDISDLSKQYLFKVLLFLARNSLYKCKFQYLCKYVCFQKIIENFGSFKICFIYV